MRENEKLAFAKTLRKTMTDAEQKLWYYLRAGRFFGYKFRRQAPIESYIADFLCAHLPLIVEVDGGQHATDNKKDILRDSILRKRGYTVLRFWNNDVLTNTEGALMTIETALKTSPLPHPSPARRRGEKGSARA